MKKWLDIGKKLLFLHPVIIVLFVIATVGLLIYSLGYPDANMAVAYFSYLFSAYTLAVVVVRVPAVVKAVRGGLYSNKYSRRYLTDRQLRYMISLHLGLGINVFYAVMKFLAGMYFHSVWLGALAVYYVVIAFMRYALLKRERYSNKYETEEEKRLFGLKSYRFCGGLMFLLNIAVSLLVVQLIWRNQSYSYPGLLIYAFAAYTFYCFITAIINIVKYRKIKQPILSATKMLAFASALTSLLALQTALLTEFGESGQEVFVRLMNSATGGTVCFTVFMMAVSMIVKANREIEKMEGRYGNG